MKIAGHSIVEVAKRTFKDFREDDLQGAAAEIAYHVLFAIVPLFLFLAALTGFVSRMIGVANVMDDVTRWLEDNLPRDTARVVVDPIQNIVATQAGGILSFGILTALWGAKNAIGSLIKGLNIAFDAKEARPWWKRQLLAIGLTIALGLALVASSAIFVYGSMFGGQAAELVGLGETWATLWAYLQWPLIVVLLLTALAFLYWAGPNVETRFQWVTPGSVLAVVLWGLATYGLGFYFARFAGYTAYGALGAVMAFVFWLYVMGLILLLGGELNAVVAKMAGTARPVAPADYAARAAATGHAAKDDRMEPNERERHPAPAPSGGGVTARTADPVAPPDLGVVRSGDDARPTTERSRSTNRRLDWRRIGSRARAAGLAAAKRLGRRRTRREAVGAVTVPPLPGTASVEPDAAPRPLSRAEFGPRSERTVGELRAAVDAGIVAKSELQLYGLDWSQLALEPDDARLADVFARHGAILDPAERPAAGGVAARSS